LYYDFEYTASTPRYTRHSLASVTIGNGKFYTLETGSNERRWDRRQGIHYRSMRGIVESTFAKTRKSSSVGLGLPDLQRANLDALPQTVPGERTKRVARGVGASERFKSERTSVELKLRTIPIGILP